jgi:hypothetical protein
MVCIISYRLSPLGPLSTTPAPGGVENSTRAPAATVEVASNLREDPAQDGACGKQSDVREESIGSSDERM